MGTLRTLGLAMVLAAPLLALSPQSEWLRAQPDYAWSFPEDHGPHPGYKTEWWYFTGLLADSGVVGNSGVMGDAGLMGDEAAEDRPPDLGYQFTLFKVGVLPAPPASSSPWATTDVLMGHMAITDLETGAHVFREVLHRAAPPLAGFPTAPDNDTIAWSLAPAGTSGRWVLRRTDTGFALAGAGAELHMNLALDTVSPMVFQGPNGYSRKSSREGRASMYYSYTDLRTSGTVEVDGQARAVTGTSWMDHEFSSDPLEEAQVGWDWFSLRLNDGRAVMAFQLRDSTGAPGFRHLTVTRPGEEDSYPDAGAWSLTPRTSPESTWESPETEAIYPVGWTVQLQGGEGPWTVAAMESAAENVSKRIPGLFYWEGPVEVTDAEGAVIGRGYLEMTGYGEGSRPAL
ncbi:MAG: carotenoid 1,2-hydratase [Gemmatimonadetes bacterium]|nr:carotenoid 1,2-hydratase [Gemmatimonadota bacterium]